MGSAAEATYVVRKVLLEEEHALGGRYLWVSEKDRWQELVTALLKYSLDQPEPVIRNMVQLMADLELLEPGGLSSRRTEDRTQPAHRIYELLIDGGADPEEARNAVDGICDAAAGLQERFEGKVARYLRRYGESIIDDIPQYFRFTSLTDKQVTDAFTYWLQQTTGMPLSLATQEMDDFASEYGLTTKELIEAADELDLNLAVLDDLCMLHGQRHRAEGADESAQDQPP